MEFHRLYWGYNKICEIQKSKIIFYIDRKIEGISNDTQIDEKPKKRNLL